MSGPVFIRPTWAESSAVRDISLENLTKLSDTFQLTLSELFQSLSAGSKRNRSLRNNVNELRPEGSS